MAANIPPFPKDSAVFACEDVIPNLLKRTELAAWFHDIIKNQMAPNHPSHERLNQFPIILYNSLEKTKELYNIQSKLNIDSHELEAISPQNYCYEPLFQSHEIWHKMALELQVILHTISSESSSWGKIIQLHKEVSSPSGRFVITLLLANQFFPVILRAMEANTNKMIRFINDLTDV